MLLFDWTCPEGTRLLLSTGKGGSLRRRGAAICEGGGRRGGGEREREREREGEEEEKWWRMEEK